MGMRIGYGFDSHAFKAGVPLVRARSRDNGAGATVAVGLKEPCQLLWLDLAVDGDVQARSGKCRARGNPLHQSVHRGEYETRSGGLVEQPCERGDALRDQRAAGASLEL